MTMRVMARRRRVVPFSPPEACPWRLLRTLTCLLFAPLLCEGVERGWTVDSSVSERFQPMVLTPTLTLFFALLNPTLSAILSGTLRLCLASRLLRLFLFDLGFVASSLFAVQRSEAILAVLPRSTFFRSSSSFLLRLGFPARVLFVLGGDGVKDFFFRLLTTSDLRFGRFLFPAAAAALDCAVISGVLLQALTFDLVKVAPSRDAFRLRKASDRLLVLMQSSLRHMAPIFVLELGGSRLRMSFGRSSAVLTVLSVFFFRLAMMTQDGSMLRLEVLVLVLMGSKFLMRALKSTLPSRDFGKQSRRVGFRGKFRLQFGGFGSSLLMLLPSRLEERRRAPMICEKRAISAGSKMLLQRI